MRPQIIIVSVIIALFATVGFETIAHFFGIEMMFYACAATLVIAAGVISVLRFREYRENKRREARWKSYL